MAVTFVAADAIATADGVYDDADVEENRVEIEVPQLEEEVPGC
jgi:hypothetical protein